MTKRDRLITRRRILAAGTASAATFMLGGCDRVSDAPSFQEFMAGFEGLTYRVQRTLLRRNARAREYALSDVSATFRPNGSQDPYNLPPVYEAWMENGFEGWGLQVGGLVRQPVRLSLADLRALPQQTQITRHDCVEGWSCIGRWTGPRLSAVLSRVGLLPEARFVVFHCADEVLRYVDGKYAYYESIDLIDAFHPQTILAYELNGVPLPLGNGAPLRVRIERQLGYKMAKFLTRIEVTDRVDRIRGGHGGYWEDQGYEWYAGI
jgi:DMSO/TMAO reductase YedYZ molybdopterin-dependent catalytic subunit